MTKNNVSRKGKRTGGEKNALVRFMSSVKLTIAVLILLAVLSIIGTIIPQNASEADYLRHYGPRAFEVLQRLGFLDVYHSWWFIGLLAFLSLNLIICSTKNLPRTWRIIAKTNPTLADEQCKTILSVSTIRSSLSIEGARERLLPFIRRHFGAPVETDDGKALHFFTEKAKFSRLGVYVVHLSVVIILIGGLIGSLIGFRGNVTILEGESADRIVIFNKGMSLMQLGFEIRCDDFTVTYYPNGAPKDYKSTLTIVENGKAMLTKEIEVNHPLLYKGLTFYQSSYGTAAYRGEIILAVKKKNDENAPKEVFTIEPGATFEISPGGLTVKANRFFTDFVIDSQGKASNQSHNFNNPAVELLVYRDGKLQYRTWVFQKFPDFHGGKERDYEFILQGFTGKEYTGLQVTKDPGVELVWTGCILMLIGIVCTFFASHRQVWARLALENGTLTIVLAGTTNKNRLAFKKEFERFETNVRDSCQ